MSSHHEGDSKSKRRKSRSRSRERRRSKERSPEARKRKKNRCTAWDDPSVPIVPGQFPPVLSSQLAAEPQLLAPGSLVMPTSPSQVYVGNITFGITEEEIRFVFERCGFVKHIQLIKDAESHKAYSFVDYETNQAAELALSTLDGFELAGRKLKVGRPMNPTPTRNTLQASGSTVIPMLLGSDDSVALRHGLPVLASIKWGEPGEPTPPPKYPLKAEPKVYASCLPADATEDELKILFSNHGAIRSVEMGDKDGCHYAFVKFMSDSAAERAVAKMNGYELRGFKLKVGRALPSPLSPAAVLSAMANAPAPIPAQQESIEDNNLLSGGSARMNLMRKLMRGGEEPEIFKHFTPQGPASTAIPSIAPPMSLVQAGLSASPTRCVVLKNLVASPADVDDDLGEEVKDECSKFGKVEHLLIYDETHPVTKAVEVFIFVLYSTLESSCMATIKLNNRFFARRQIICSYFDERAFRRLMDS